jgi:hypothetical protein
MVMVIGHSYYQLLLTNQRPNPMNNDIFEPTIIGFHLQLVFLPRR